MTLGERLALLRDCRIPTPSLQSVGDATKLSRKTVAVAEADRASEGTLDHLCRYYRLTLDELKADTPPAVIAAALASHQSATGNSQLAVDSVRTSQVPAEQQVRDMTSEVPASTVNPPSGPPQSSDNSNEAQDGPGESRDTPLQETG